MSCAAPDLGAQEPDVPTDPLVLGDEPALSEAEPEYAVNFVHCFAHSVNIL